MDVVGVGALNLDFVVAGTSEGLPVARGAEGRVPSSVVLPFLGGRPVLGGSAFNVVSALGGRGLSLGYVGATGAESPHAGHLASLGVDHRYVFPTDDLTGTCVSIVESDDRTLLVHPGANSRLAELIKKSFNELVEYLGSARFVHLTSFLDEATPGRLATLMRAVRARGTKLSLDPGHEWTHLPSAAVQNLITQADYLFLNEREYAALHPLDAHPGTVLVKYPNGIRTLHRGTSKFTSHTPLPPNEVQNPTGAGDAFAAGYLAAHLAHHPTPEAQALSEARTHLRRPRSGGARTPA